MEAPENKILQLISRAGKVILWESPIHQKLNKSSFTQSTWEINSPGLAPGKNENKSKIDQAIILYSSSPFYGRERGSIYIYIDAPDGFGQDTFCQLFVFIQSVKKAGYVSGKRESLLL